MTCRESKLGSELTCRGDDELTEGEFVGEERATS